MSDAILPLRRYFEFTGRSRRREYWLWSIFSYVFVLVFVVILLVIEAIMGVGGNFRNQTDVDWPIPTLPSDWFLLIWFLATIIPNIALTARRLQDTNRSVRWILILAIPYIGVVIFFILLCLPGTPGANRFGPDPKGRGDGLPPSPLIT